LGYGCTAIGTDLFQPRRRVHFGQETLLGGVDLMVVAIEFLRLRQRFVLQAFEGAMKTRGSCRRQRGQIPKLLNRIWQSCKACRFAFLNGSIRLLDRACRGRARFPRQLPMDREADRNPPAEIRHRGSEGRRRAPKAPTMPITAAALGGHAMLTLGIRAGIHAIMLSATGPWGVKHRSL